MMYSILSITHGIAFATYSGSGYEKPQSGLTPLVRFFVSVLSRTAEALYQSYPIKLPCKIAGADEGRA